jgi:hypothetical protein
MSRATEPLWRHDPARWAERRAQFVRSEYGLEYRRAITLAYSEIGFSSSGIAARTQFAEATVRGYLDELAAEFGEPAVWFRPPEEIGVEAELGGEGE